MATNQLRRVIHTLREATAPADGAGLSDGQLLERYLADRDEASFAALVRRHGPMVWGVVRRVLGGHQDAEDAFQATFLVLVRKAASVAAKELVANWLYGVAHRTALKARATAARRRGREKQVTAMPEPAQRRQQLWDELGPLLDHELSQLPDKYRALIVLCDLEGKTRKEAARHFRLPEGTVGSRLATARALLAKRLARHGLPATGAAVAVALAQNAATAGVPAAVVEATVLAGGFLAAGRTAAAGVISARALTLAEGVLKTMLLTKLKIATAVLAVLAAVAALATGAAALSLHAPAENPPAPPAKEKQALPAKPADQPVKEHKEDEPRPATVSGIAMAVDAEKKTLRLANREGADTFTVAAGAKIEMDNKPAALAWVPRGAIVTLSQFEGPKTARNVQASGWTYFGAPLKAVDADRNAITIGTNRNDAEFFALIYAAKNVAPGKDRPGERALAVAKDAPITVDGKLCKLAAVPVGAMVNVRLAADQETVCCLNADGPCVGDCGGSLVKAVDAAQNTITFDEKASASVAGKTFTVARDALVTIDGKGGTLAAVPAGCYVRLTLRVDGRTAGMVWAQGPSNVCDCGGSLVKAVDVERRTITFDDKARAEVAGKTFTLAKNALVYIDGKVGALEAVGPGCYVQMNLLTDGQTVGMVWAQGPSNVCDCGGSCVTAVDAERRTITFDAKARAEVAGKTFTVAKDAIVAIDANPGALAALPVGCYVQMNLCTDGKTVGMIFAQGAPVPGVGLVKAVDVAKGTITVEGRTYPVAKNANILFDGKTCGLSGVRPGEYVTLRLCVDGQTAGTIFQAKAP
jgi:RNA polymerase sigma factor (sigma-70 family)